MTAPRAESIAVMFSALLAVTHAFGSEQRIVLLQTDWPGSLPHYVTIQGGRNRDQLHLMLKTGRHPPSDEWILREVTPGKLLLESNDPFYRQYVITFTHPIPKGPLQGAHPTYLWRGVAQIEDAWTMETEADGFKIFKSARKGFEDHVLVRARRDGEHTHSLLAQKLAPENRHEARFKIIDITPTTPTPASRRSDPAAPP